MENGGDSHNESFFILVTYKLSPDIDMLSAKTFYIWVNFAETTSKQKFKSETKFGAHNLLLT